jgi:hypothetical protein
MFLHVTDAKHVTGYRIWIKFNTGEEGTVDLTEELWGDMFAPLKDPGAFRRFRVDPEIETIVWENGADLAPDFLHGLLKKAA